MKIVTIGGGSGSFNLLYGLKQNPDFDLSAIIAMCDSGGTTGAIRDKFGILPPGDVRRAVAALAKNTGMVRKLFEYKFDEDGVIGGNKVGNILLTALNDITGSFETGLDALCDMFDVQGKIIPVTLEDVHLGVKFEDGVEVIGEKNIDISDKNPGERTHNPDATIIDAFLVGGHGELNPRAYTAITQADIVIIGPGDLYTSIVPNLLSNGMKEALTQASGKIIYICNIMTKRGETTNLGVKDFIDVIEKYIGEGILDFVIVNNGFISDQTVERYKNEEGKKPVKIKTDDELSGKTYKVIEADLVDEADVVRHSPKKTAQAIQNIIFGK